MQFIQEPLSTENDLGSLIEDLKAAPTVCKTGYVCSVGEGAAQDEPEPENKQKASVRYGTDEN